MPKYKDYIPLPGGVYENQETIKWITENTKDPAWSWSRTQSKIYRRPVRPRVLLGVYLSSQDATAVRLKFIVKDFN